MVSFKLERHKLLKFRPKFQNYCIKPLSKSSWHNNLDQATLVDLTPPIPVTFPLAEYSLNS